MPTIPPSSGSPPDRNSAEPEAARVAQELAPEDFYYEGPYLVFTADYHLRRGYCCNSGCRHCPYRDYA